MEEEKKPPPPIKVKPQTVTSLKVNATPVKMAKPHIVTYDKVQPHTVKTWHVTDLSVTLDVTPHLHTVADIHFAEVDLHLPDGAVAGELVVVVQVEGQHLLSQVFKGHRELEVLVIVRVDGPPLHGRLAHPLVYTRHQGDTHVGVAKGANGFRGWEVLSCGEQA